MAQIWFKGNKANQKWTEDEVEEIFNDALNYVEDNEKICLIIEVELYFLKVHSLGHDTYKNWLNKTYINNLRIHHLWEAACLTIENRIVKDQEILRPNIQALVLQTKHNYRERKESEQTHKFAKMPKIKIGNNDLEINIGE